jgi:hypothetical protein
VATTKTTETNADIVKRKRSCIPAPAFYNTARWLIPSAFMLSVGVAFFTSTGQDDSYISYWPAWTLSHGEGIINYSRDRVEMSSSLLWVIILAISTKLTSIPLPTLGPIVSILFGVLGIAMVARISDQLRHGSGIVAAMLAATSLPFLYWTFGAMETTLVACLFLGMIRSWAAVVAKEQHASRLVLPTTLAMMVRPEMPIVAICLSLVLLLMASRWRALKEALAAFGVVVISTLALITFRWCYFGDIVPQPVHAKVPDLTLQRIHDGLSYVISQAQDAVLVPLVLSSLFAVGYLLLRCRLSITALSCLCGSLTYIGFAIFAGGDWMTNARFLVPAILPLAILAAQPATKYVYFALTVVICIQSYACIKYVDTAHDGMSFSQAIRIYRSPYGRGFGWFDCGNINHVNDMEAARSFSKTLAKSTKQRPTIASGQMGMVLFHALTTSRLHVRVIDWNSLQDRTFMAYERSLEHTPFGSEAFAIHWQAVRERRMVPPDIVYAYRPDCMPADMMPDYSQVFLQEGIHEEIWIRNHSFQQHENNLTN